MSQLLKKLFSPPKASVAVIATGWVGDTIACTAAATSLSEKGYAVTFFTRWPQLVDILRNDGRFKVVLYGHLRLRPLLKFFLPLFFEKIIWEPEKWSYQEPFTSEIRRIAGCEPRPEYQLFLNPEKKLASLSPSVFPTIAVSRDLYKRAFGRDIDDFVAQLQTIGQIQWVGLPPQKSSKHGKAHNLLSDAKIISQSNLFIGPEGGLLWLAAGIDTPCVYFTEHIVEVAKKNNISKLDHVLGSKNHFPNKSIYIPLAAYCSNSDAIKIIQTALYF